MTEHFLYFTSSTRRGIYIFCGIIVILLIYKHLAADRIQTQRIDQLEAELAEVLYYINHNNPDGLSIDKVHQSAHAFNDGPENSTSPLSDIDKNDSLQINNKHNMDAPAEMNPNSPSTHRPYDSGAKFKTPMLVDLNSADSALLTRIPGIGEKTAAAILRYRVRLGGYTHLEQLTEAARWIQAENLNQWQGKWLTANVSKVHQLSVNTADFRTLLKHPYLEYAQVKAIFQVREKLGHVSSWEDLVSTGVFAQSDVDRLKDYLTFE